MKPQGHFTRANQSFPYPLRLFLNHRVNVLRRVHSRHFRVRRQESRRNLFQHISLRHLRNGPHTSTRTVRPSVHPRQLRTNVSDLRFQSRRPQRGPLETIFPYTVLKRISDRRLPTHFANYDNGAFYLFLTTILAVRVRMGVPTPTTMRGNESTHGDRNLFFRGKFSLSSRTLRSREHFICATRYFSSSLLSIFFVVTRPPTGRGRGKTTTPYCKCYDSRFGFKDWVASPYLRLRRQDHRRTSPNLHPSKDK